MVGGVGVGPVVALGRCPVAGGDGGCCVRGSRLDVTGSTCWGSHVGLVGGPPVACDRVLCGSQADAVVAHECVQPVLDDILGARALGTVVGLGPQVGGR